MTEGVKERVQDPTNTFGDQGSVQSGVPELQGPSACSSVWEEGEE